MGFCEDPLHESVICAIECNILTIDSRMFCVIRRNFKEAFLAFNPGDDDDVFGEKCPQILMRDQLLCLKVRHFARCLTE